MKAIDYQIRTYEQKDGSYMAALKRVTIKGKHKTSVTVYHKRNFNSRYLARNAAAQEHRRIMEAVA